MAECAYENSGSGCAGVHVSAELAAEWRTRYQSMSLRGMGEWEEAWYPRAHQVRQLRCEVRDQYSVAAERQNGER